MKKYLLLLLASIVATTTLSAANNIKSWTTGEYENNTNLSKTLKIDKAKVLKVTVNGNTEQGADFIYIYDQNNKLVRKVSGNMHEAFKVLGSSIKVQFISDDSKTSSGATVSIKNISNKPHINNSTWKTGAYGNYEDSQMRLYINGANKLKVSIKGKTEQGYDFVSIYDSKGKLIKKLSGKINKNFIVNGSNILAKLTSDDSTTDKGVRIHISPVREFTLYTYAPPTKSDYPDVNETWDYYKGANLDTISRIDPTNKPLFKSAENKKHNLKYYLDIRHMVFSTNGNKEDSRPGLDKNGVDLLRGYNEDTDEANVKTQNISKATLKNLKKIVKQYKNDPNLKGYWICDEPFPSAFENLKKVIKTIKKIDPYHPSIVNIGRNEYTADDENETKDREKINKFLKNTGIKMFSFNFSIFWRYSEINGTKYYGGWEGESEERQVKLYYQRMKDIRDIAQDNNSDFMYVAQLVGTEGKDPVEPSPEHEQGLMWKTPNENELRWEAYTALTYGAHGLSWFFWEYSGNESQAWGLVDKPDKEQGILYEALQNVNKDISKLKDIMATLKSTKVYDNDKNLAQHKPIVAENNDSSILVGLFEKISKRFYKHKHYFMLTNKDYNEELTENYYLKINRKDYPDMPDNVNINLEYFDISTNQWKRVELDKNKFTTYLDAGEGKLFRFTFY